ncbi:helix-turn-helix domain-containing protein [Paenibacillus spongiae]|uniref:Helix-turn-helix domain-containing protein n=1 Tax=Paenibacillus spongiae TaxID=2909671 RepID=A0ABY5SB51_9BACL|nr:helix-turn-helix domain-containing protein [Paenibacillus spongiae]UVI31177.1 helix-turn-helix domain-containing protein [Paenibacillus spongiae]
MSDEQYPPLLTAKHVAQICSCHINTAYEIMKQPHRPVWKQGKMVRLLRDDFLEQLKQESKRGA